MRVLLLAQSAGDWWDRLGIEDPAAWDLVQAARRLAAGDQQGSGAEAARVALPPFVAPPVFG